MALVRTGGADYIPDQRIGMMEMTIRGMMSGLSFAAGVALIAAGGVFFYQGIAAAKAHDHDALRLIEYWAVGWGLAIVMVMLGGSLRPKRVHILPDPRDS